MAHDLTPDRLFERQWAILVLQRAFQELETEQVELGHQAQFESLAPFVRYVYWLGVCPVTTWEVHRLQLVRVRPLPGLSPLPFETSQRTFRNWRSKD